MYGLLIDRTVNQSVRDPATPRCQSLGAPVTLPGLFDEGGFAAGLGAAGLAGTGAGAGATGVAARAAGAVGGAD